MVQTIKDVDVRRKWIDLFSASVATAGTNVRVQNKGDDCVVAFGTQPTEESEDGYLLERGNSIVIGAEPNIWCKSLEARSYINIEEL